MAAIAPLLPTNTPPPMIPPMEIIIRCRASRDRESFAEAGEASTAFNGFALVAARGRAPYAFPAAVEIPAGRSAIPREPENHEDTSMNPLKIARAGLLILAAALDLPSFGATKTGYAKANGISYYYEIAGQGEPLL